MGDPVLARFAELVRSWRKGTAVLIWAAVLVTMAITFYVNHYMPHGRSYPTGDYVCLNDDRGPCGAEYKENMKGLDIPGWAKFLRTHFELMLLPLLVGGILLSVGPDYEGSPQATQTQPNDSAEPTDDDLKQATAAEIEMYKESRLSTMAQIAPPAPLLINETIERAARALAICAKAQHPDEWRPYVPVVRTVLEALDQPTASMIDAGNVAMRQTWAARGLTAPSVAGDAAVAAAWDAMIDNVLGYS